MNGREESTHTRRSRAARRTAALRASGYDGPIDQDGYPDHQHDDILAALAAISEIQSKGQRS